MAWPREKEDNKVAQYLLRERRKAVFTLLVCAVRAAHTFTEEAMKTLVLSMTDRIVEV